MNRHVLLCLLPVLTLTLGLHAGESLTSHVQFESGPVNSVRISADDQVVVVYGDPADEPKPANHVLLTHHRRDVAWAARELVAGGAALIAPEAEKDLITDPQAYWDNFTTARVHDYAQQSSKVLATPIDVKQSVKDGDSLTVGGIDVQVIQTPGFTRGAVSYIVEVDGKRFAFTGDLIYDKGQILDLYSFQDAIKEANIGGYHGYGGRLGDLVASLGKIKAAKPDFIVPARGNVMRDADAAIDSLVGRVQALYKNYLSTNALHWYFKKDRMTICGERVLGEGADVELMPYSLHQESPDWIHEQATSRVIISDTGSAFLLDCGSQRIFDAIKKMVTSGLIKKIDGIFVTHFHDDHTNHIQAASEAFDCPIYATREYADVLRHPQRYKLPAQTDAAMKVRAFKDGHVMKWNEFEFTFRFYPGQTLYHGGLLVRKEGERPIFFIGDAFAPSGLDDYCTLNRNLLHEDTGYLYCLKMLRDFKEPYWLINEHIPFVFSYTDAELDYLESRYRQRIDLQRKLYPWDDPNYGVDEQWAWFYPYGETVEQGKSQTFSVRLTNHSSKTRTYTVTAKTHGGVSIVDRVKSVKVKSRATKEVRFKATAGDQPGNFIITADIQSEGIDLREWAEAMVTVK